MKTVTNKIGKEYTNEMKSAGNIAMNVAKGDFKGAVTQVVNVAKRANKIVGDFDPRNILYKKLLTGNNLKNLYNKLPSFIKNKFGKPIKLAISSIGNSDAIIFSVASLLAPRGTRVMV